MDTPSSHSLVAVDSLLFAPAPQELVINAQERTPSLTQRLLNKLIPCVGSQHFDPADTYHLKAKAPVSPRDMSQTDVSQTDGSQSECWSVYVSDVMKRYVSEGEDSDMSEAHFSPRA